MYFEFQAVASITLKIKRKGVSNWDSNVREVLFWYLAASTFGILEEVAVDAAFELDFSASSPLSESESLLSEESDESLEQKAEH